jgi:hypothetical protein
MPRRSSAAVGIVVPVGVALWASVSTDVDQRLSDLSAPWRLQPDEWCSGDTLWLVELVGDLNPTGTPKAPGRCSLQGQGNQDAGARR